MSAHVEIPPSRAKAPDDRQPDEDPDRLGGHSRKRRLWAARGSALLGATIIAVVAFGSLPFKLYLGPTFADASDVTANLVPQAWGFFTKDPREPVLVPYTETDGTWAVASRGANASVERAFGWDRSARLTEYDIQLVLADAQESAWHACATDASVSACVDEALIAEGSTEVTVRADAARLCGRVAIAREELVPMSFSRQIYEPPREIMVRDVTCVPVQGDT